MHPIRFQISNESRAVAVYGAAGHTGHFVVAELLRRGLEPIAIARDPARLMEEWTNGVAIRSATIDDPASLRDALAGAAVVVNCAGPFLETAEALVEAALSCGVHYLDVTAEQASAAATLDRFDAPARK